MEIDKAFLIKTTNDIIIMCVKCVSKCEVILGEKFCDDSFYKRILPYKIFIANSTLYVKNNSIASTLVYQTYNGSMMLSDFIGDDSKRYLLSELSLLIFATLCIFILYMFPKNSVDSTVIIKTEGNIVKKKKKKKMKKKSNDNPATWGLYSENYSEC